MPLPRLRRLSATPLPHRLLPTPRSSNPGLLFLSFDVNSARCIDLLHRRPPSSPPPLAAVAALPASRTSLRSSNSALISSKSSKKPSRSSTLSESIITSMRTPISLDLFSSS
ncbi:protein transport protein yip1 [Phtheirospermum japonicum]|uniref:Protein transport protein yip1 n=1 Tax=Phtheirospermum japonicum TaxID=374723 RepID=A0A830B8B4_9LAMI|nr:protein transport protein yip1 [Phtheirospermum japonicum]